MSVRPRTLSFVPMIALFVSCYQGNDDELQPGITGAPGADEHMPPEVERTPLGTSLFVKVTDPQGKPISRARVSLPPPVVVPGEPTGVRSASDLSHLMQPVARYLDGRSEYRTDGAGQLLLEELERFVGDRLVARVEAPGYAPASVVLAGITPDSHMAATVILLPVAATAAFDSRQGTLLEHAGLRVEIPANGVVDEFGNRVDGLVEISVVPFDSTTQALLQPGPLQATRTNGDDTALRSLGMAEVSLWRDGVRLQLAPGAKARLELPLPASLVNAPKIGDEIPAWWFDLDAGLWREDGVGSVIAATGRPGELAWTTDVSHFTWWNVDEPWTDHSCLFVTIHKDGMPVQGVTVQVKGAWGASMPQVTDANGQACTAIKRNEVGKVYVGDPAMPLVPPFDVMGKADAAACDGNGNACQPLPIDIGPDDFVCTPGSSYACKYTGPEGTEDVGICVAGKNFCNGQGQWDGCMGQVGPDPLENPATPDDDNCNGYTDDGVDAECLGLDEEPAKCYLGPAGTVNVGECAAGEKKCIVDPNDPNVLIWGECIGEIPPDVELCNSPLDEDCDGNPGCGLATWAQSGGDAFAQALSAVAVGSNGDVFVLGRGAGTMKLGNKVLPLGATEQAMLAHLLPDGTVVDLKALGTDLTGALHVAVRGNQQVFVTATLDAPNSPLPGLFQAGACDAVGSDDVDGLLIEFDATTCKRTRVLGGANGSSFPTGAAVGGDVVYVAGAFGGPLGPLTTPMNQDDAFVVGLDATDITKPLLVAEQFATGWPTYNVNRPALAATPNGFAMAFAYGNIVTLAGQNFASPSGDGSTLIALFNPQGVAQWAANLGDYDAAASTGYAIAVDEAGRITVAADHGQGLRVSQWQEAAGAHWSFDVVNGVLAHPELGGARLAVAPMGRVVLNATQTVNGVQSAYMQKFRSNGETDWTHVAGTMNPARPTHGLGVAASLFEHATFVTGQVTGDTVFPDAIPVAIGEANDIGDGFVAKLQE